MSPAWVRLDWSLRGRRALEALILEFWSADLEHWRANLELWWADFDIGRYHNLLIFVEGVGGLNGHFEAIIWWFRALGALWSIVGVYTRPQGLIWSFGAYWSILELIGAYWSLLDHLCSICAQFVLVCCCKALLWFEALAVSLQSHLSIAILAQGLECVSCPWSAQS
jgi:hypothetical protein